MFNKSSFKKVSTYLFLSFVVACVVIFAYAFTKLLKFASGTSDANFINIYQMIFSVVAIVVLAIYLSFIKIAKLKTSQFFDCLLMTSLFLLFGIYPCFDLFASMVANCVLFGIFGFVFSVISLSVFYFAEKSQNGTVKANTGFLLFFVILFEIFAILIFEIVLHFILKPTGINMLSGALDFLIYIACSLVGNLIFVIFCVVSLIREKKFLNLCLCLRISD